MTQIKLNAAARIAAVKFTKVNPKLATRVRKFAKMVYAHNPEVTSARELSDGWEGSFHTDTASYAICDNIKKLGSFRKVSGGRQASSTKFQAKTADGSILDIEVESSAEDCNVKIRETTA